MSAQTVTRSTDDVASGLVRQLAAFGRRVGQGDPDELTFLKQLRAELDTALAAAVLGLRAAGFSDGQIGRELGVTGQAVNKRWPRAQR